MHDFLKRNIPLFTLILLAPVLGELLSGSAPPLEFFNPIGFVMLTLLYGFGALIVRELSIKWKGKIDWGTILLLGMAYGIIEEALAAKSFFDPYWMDLGNLGEYGRVFGVNWVWAIYLTIYHTIVSIAIPILLFELIFPDKKNERLVTDKKFYVVGLIFVLVVCFDFLFIPSYNRDLYFNLLTIGLIINNPMFVEFVIISDIFFKSLFITPYYPDLIHVLLSLGIIILLFLIAWKIKPDIVYPKNKQPTIKAGWFWLMGLIFIILLFLINMALPNIFEAFFIPIILNIFLTTLLLMFIIHYGGYENNSYHKLTFASGILSFFIFLAIIHEINGMLGMSAVGIFFIIFLLLLRRKVLEEGIPIEKETKTTSKYCVSCGFHLKPGKTKKYCPNCGKEL